MTRGVVLFAHNNDDIDYVEMAKFSASRIKKYLDLPIMVYISHYVMPFF
jgi:hypothetical protein